MREANGSAPLFSVITQVVHADPVVLQGCVGSVLAQRYPRWEHVLADPKAVYKHGPEADPRVRVARGDALEATRGRFVLWLDPHDRLDPEMLAELAAVIADNPDADLIYTDEDIVDAAGNLLGPIYKPDWSPELLLGCDYIRHPVYRRALIAGGFDDDYGVAQGWELVLRVTASTERIHHVPKRLYRQWSSGADETEQPAAQPWLRRCIEDRVRERFGAEALCEEAPLPGAFWVSRPVARQPLVSVIIPTVGARPPVMGGGGPLVLSCIASLLEKTEYQNYELIVILDPQTPAKARAAIESLSESRVRMVNAGTPFNFAERMNLGAAHARGEHLLLLNDDIVASEGGWMNAMVELSQDPGIGAVGAKLLYPDGRVQHCGVGMLPWLHQQFPYHVFRGYARDHPGHQGSLVLDRNFAAVTGACLMTRTEVFDELGGLDVDFAVNLNDIDYCFRAREHGYRVVCTPRAELYHYESASRPYGVMSEEEKASWTSRWGDIVDPYWRPEAETAQSYFSSVTPAASPSR